MDDLRAQFPVLERLAYLNAGSNGPVPRAALDAVHESLRHRAVRARVQVREALEDGELGAQVVHGGRILGSGP